MNAMIRCWVVAGLAATIPAWGVASQAKNVKPFKSDAAAVKLYKDTIAAMRKAKSLELTYSAEFLADGKSIGKGNFKMWLKKPNYARVEGYLPGQTKPSGILVLDGQTLWTYWPNGKPRFGWEYTGKLGEAYEKNKNTFYMQARAPLAQHSIGHAMDMLGTGTSLPIIDPSTFHGYTDSLQPYFDGAMSMGKESVDGELCDVIEVSLMKRQRSWILWVSRKDHLPHRLQQVIRVKYDLLQEERVSSLKVNQPIADSLFAWKVPDSSWKQWRMPRIEEGLLAPGTTAPDFELPLIDGGKVKLSDYRGKVVWLNIWRCG